MTESTDTILDVSEGADFGVTLEDILSGKASAPMQGARIDVAFEGRATGRLAGDMRGIDHLRIRGLESGEVSGRHQEQSAA